MKVVCISDCEGDFWNLTVNKEYFVLNQNNNHLLYVENGKKITEERILIRDDYNEKTWYPKRCFKII